MLLSGYIIVLILIFAEVLNILVEKVNDKYITNAAANPPKKVLDIYSKDEIAQSSFYHIDKSKVAYYENVMHGILFFSLLLLGTFQWFSSELIDTFGNEYKMAFIFFLVFRLFFGLIGLPFDIYETFVVEKKYHFNKITPLLYVRDLLVGGIVSFAIFTVLLFLVMFLISSAGRFWYIYAAVAVFMFSMLMMYLYPTLIAPLFNKFEPLKDKNLKEKIFKLAEKAKFPLKNIMQMDASKRSSHSNAYFTGFGKNKRIVLFDTLLQNHKENEILNILAHEIGHYKLGHLKKILVFMFVSVFVSFFLVHVLISSDFIYDALGFEKSIFIGLFILSFLLAPADTIFAPLFSSISRKHEYEADKFAVSLTGDISGMKEALIKLHKDNLSFPLPHPVYVKMHYSHPPLPERIYFLEKIREQ